VRASSICKHGDMRVVAAVIVRDSLVLACRRAQHKSLSGFWEFPGGKVEPDETDSEALSRELHEELGISVKVGDLLTTSYSKSNGLEIEMHTYLCELTSDPPASSSDHDQLIWIKTSELGGLKWPPLDIPVVERLVEIS
jgi:8-oxo-dGTP diphosphatase